MFSVLFSGKLRHQKGVLAVFEAKIKKKMDGAWQTVDFPVMAKIPEALQKGEKYLFSGAGYFLDSGELPLFVSKKCWCIPIEEDVDFLVHAYTKDQHITPDQKVGGKIYIHADPKIRRSEEKGELSNVSGAIGHGQIFYNNGLNVSFKKEDRIIIDTLDDEIDALASDNFSTEAIEYAKHLRRGDGFQIDFYEPKTE